MKIKYCMLCKKEFHVHNHRDRLAKYCSVKCFHEGIRTKKNIEKERTCKSCKKKYLATTYYQRFCTRQCYYLFVRRGLERKCAACDKLFYPPRRTSKFCSPECIKTFLPPGRKRRDFESFPNKGKNTHLDNLWGKVIHLKSGGHCEYCKERGTLNAHHIFSRSNFSTRWDLDNGIALCVGHHVFGNFSAHKSPVEFVEWLKEVRGEDWYNNLRIKAKTLILDLESHKTERRLFLEKHLNDLTQKISEEKIIAIKNQGI